MSAVDQVLRNVQGRLKMTFFVDGVPTDPDGDEAFVDVWLADGEDFDVAAATTREDTGTYMYELAPRATLMRFDLRWSGVFDGVTQSIDSQAEVVGGFLFTVAELRTFKGALQSTATYPTSAILDIREEITQFFAEECRVAFAPRYGRAVVDGRGGTELYLPSRKVTRVLSAKASGTAMDHASMVAYDDGLLYSPSGFPEGRRNIAVEYEHGYAQPPGRLARAAKVYASTMLVGTDVKERAITHTDETGTYRLSYPDAFRQRPTGIPVVDAALVAYTEPLVA